MTIGEHIEAVLKAIERAGGPDQIRFAPVTVKLLEADPSSVPVLVKLTETEDHLVDATFSQVTPPESDEVAEDGQ